jgi:YndJ-like protein
MLARTSFTMIAALAGAAVWSVIAVLAGTGHAPFGIIELLFLFAPLVIVPLGMEVDRSVIPEARGPLHDFAVRLQPVAAAMAIIAFWLPPGQRAAGLSLAWAGVCAVAAGSSAAAVFRRRFSLPGLLAHVGRFDLLIGAAWLLMSRMGVHPQKYQEPIVLLTAVHFHYSGFGLATIAAVTLHTARARGWNSRFLTLSSTIVVFLPFCIAAGFVFSPTLKVASAVAFALSLATLAVILLRRSSRLVSRHARRFLTVASALVMVGMTLAVVYAVGEYVGHNSLVIPQMASTHGVLNGLGFILLGLLGWLAELHRSEGQAYGTPDRIQSPPSRLDATAKPPWPAGIQSTGHDCKALLFPARDFYDR